MVRTRSYVALFVVVLLAIAAACARANPSAAQALWSRSVTGGVENAGIDGGVLVFGLYRGGFGAATTEAYDVRTGTKLWALTGALPLPGSRLFLAVGAAVERVDARSRRILWRSRPLCGKTATAPKNANFIPPAVALPTYSAVIGKSLYIGCNGGKLFALQLSTGRVAASAYPAYLDNYDQIVKLGDNTLGIGGTASGAYMYRQSAIVKLSTLSTVRSLSADSRIIGTYNGYAVIEDTCCMGRHSDSSPGDIAFVSLESGDIASTVALHPYRTPLPRERDLPGPGVALVAGDRLYFATHSALVEYALHNLNAQPHIIYSDLADLPAIVDGRYFSIKRGTSGVRTDALLDAYEDMRVIWRDNVSAAPAASSRRSTRQELLIYNGRAEPVTVDASCMLSTSSQRYAFTVCRSADVASRAHLGEAAKPATFGSSTLLPESVAVYST